MKFSLGQRVVIIPGNPTGHTPCVGEAGTIVGLPDGPEHKPFAYAVRLSVPKETGGMTLCYHLTELRESP